MKKTITSISVVVLWAAPQTAEAFTNMICGVAGRAASQSVLAVTATATGPVAVLTGLTAASAAGLGCRLIISRATPALIATLATKAGAIGVGHVGGWIAATAASSAAALPIGAAIEIGAVVGTTGSLLDSLNEHQLYR